MQRIVFERREFAIAILGGRQDEARLIQDDERDHLFAFGQANTANTGSRAAHWANVVLVEANCFAATRAQYDLLGTVRDVGTDQAIARIKLDCDDAGLTRARERLERGLLDGSRRSRHE